MSFDADMRAAKEQSEKALESFQCAMRNYHAACARFDFKEADISRVVVEGALSAHLDHVAAQYLRLQQAQQ